MRIQMMQYIALFLYCIINVLFIQKYASRVVHLPMIVSIVYIMCLGAGWLLYSHGTCVLRSQKTVRFAVAGLFSIAAIAGFLSIPALSLNVDRWSVITSFLNKLFSGEFPYTARSHVNNLPGPFPFYFVIAMPFYFVGSIGLLVLAGYWLFIGCLERWIPRDNDKTCIVLLLSVSPAYIWEMLSRSTIFVNVAILCAFMLATTRFIKKRGGQSCSAGILFCLGIAGGCVLSTRGTIAFPLLCYYSYIFLKDKNYKQYCITLLGTGIGFAFTILPFIIWNYTLFIQYNPFVLQSYSMPILFLIVFFIAAIISGRYCRSLYEVFSVQGILMFFLVAVPFINKIICLGLTKAYYQSSFDISYFLFVLPFALLTITKPKPDNS